MAAVASRQNVIEAGKRGNGQVEGRSHLGGQIFEDGGRVDGCGGTHAAVARRPVLQVPVNTADGKLQQQ